MAKFLFEEYPANQFDIKILALPYDLQPKATKSLAQWAKESGADIVYPLAMYCMEYGTDQYGPKFGRTVQYIRCGGKDCGYGGSQWALGLDALAVIKGGNTHGGYQNVCAGYKAAIVDGRIQSGLDAASNRSRNVNGISKAGHYFHMLTSADVTEKQCAEYLAGLEVRFALLQDGGGTTAKWKDGEIVFAPEGGRGTCSVIAITRKKGAGTTVDKQYTVCVDPGHSATEAQGSPDGTYKEHEFALDVGQRLRGHLERHNVKVVMTRQTGASVSLSERCRISNAAGCDYFVSVHTNAAQDPGWQMPNGFETVICGKGGKAEQLAAKLQKEVPAALGCATRPMKVNPNLAVLNGTTCPAVICEYGFHTNQEEVEKLKGAAYRDACATATAKGVLQQLGIAWKEPTTNPQQPAWYDEHCKWVSDMGIADGQRPDNAMTRAEAFAMVHRLAEIGGISKLKNKIEHIKNPQ